VIVRIASICLTIVVVRSYRNRSVMSRRLPRAHCCGLARRVRSGCRKERPSMDQKCSTDRRIGINISLIDIAVVISIVGVIASGRGAADVGNIGEVPVNITL